MIGLGEIGTLEWTRRTNGILGRGERARYIAATVMTTSRLAPRLIAHRAGRAASGPDPSQLAPPDSQAARDAVAECVELMPETVIEHNYRSFLYARALGLRSGLAHDEELLFVATMFHDAGIVDVDLSDGGRCFTLAGAERAEALGVAHGWEAGRSAAAAEAITLHVNPGVDPAQGAEAHLMHDGVLLDAFGLRIWELDPGGLARVRQRHPRLGFSREAGRLLRAQADAIGGCRVAAAMQSGFGLALKLGSG